MKNSPSYNEFHSIQARPLYHPTFQSPSINSYNSYNSLKPTITRSLNSSKIKFSSMNNTNNNTPSHTNIKTTKNNYHRKNDSYYKVSSQIELMNMKLSFDLLNHKLKQLNSIVLPSDKKIDHKRERSNLLNIRGVEINRMNKFIHYNPVFSPLSTYVNYLDNSKMKKNSDYIMYGNKKNERDKYDNKDSIDCDLSKIASELAETFDPSANTSKNLIIGENTLETDYLKEKKENNNQNENDQNLQFLQDLIKTTKENLEKKEEHNEEINSLHSYSENEKDTNKQSSSSKKDKLKNSKKPTTPKEEKKEDQRQEKKDKKEGENDHNKVFNKIQDLFKEDDSQNNNEEVENEDENEENEDNEEQDENEEEQNEKEEENEENNEENQEEEEEDGNDNDNDDEKDQSKEESKTKEEGQLLSKENSCKKLDFSEAQEEEKNKEPSEKKSENPSENEEAEEDEDAIFAEIVKRAKELEEANQKNKEAIEQTPLKCPVKPKKTVTFSEEKKVFIKFKENDQITKLSIYDSNGKEAQFKPAKMETYLLKLKTPQKLKPIILVASVPSSALQNETDNQKKNDEDDNNKYCTSTPKRYKSPMKDANSPSKLFFIYIFSEKKY